MELHSGNLYFALSRYWIGECCRVFFTLCEQSFIHCGAVSRGFAVKKKMVVNVNVVFTLNNLCLHQGTQAAQPYQSLFLQLLRGICRVAAGHAYGVAKREKY